LKNTCRGFNSRIKNYISKVITPKSSRNISFLLLTGSIIGIGYLGYKLNLKNNLYYSSLAKSREEIPSDIVHNRVRETMLYFAGGLTLSSCLISYMLRSPTALALSMKALSKLAYLPLYLAGVTYFAYKINNSPIENQLAKHLYFAGYIGLTAFSTLPLVALARPQIVRDAFILTSGIFGGLGLTAYYSRDNAFMGASGVVGAGLGGLFAISLANLYFQSTLLNNIWLYGGVPFVLYYILYDFKRIQQKASNEISFDPISSSISAYMNFVNLMVRMIIIMENNMKRN
jgi:FtsH-binding integral membrane protein